MAFNPLKIPLFAALDVDDDKIALKIAKDIRDFVGGFKVGPRLVYRYGEKLVQNLAELAPVFVDNKYHDIPSTVIAALKATFDAGASFATVHASNGAECLREIAKLEAEFNKKRYFKVLSVTALTSLSDRHLPTNWLAQSTREHVLALARESIEAGLSGLVCSAAEASELRAKFPEAFLLTPGIRLPDAERGDQKRIMGPREALKAGSSALVVGRPIVDAANPAAAAEEFYKLIVN